MKKIEIKGKLSLNKSTIANLNNEQMNAVKGGGEAGDGGPQEIFWTLIRCREKSACWGFCDSHVV
jgi:natural product precursor